MQENFGLIFRTLNRGSLISVPLALRVFLFPAQGHPGKWDLLGALSGPPAFPALLKTDTPLRGP